MWSCKWTFIKSPFTLYNVVQGGANLCNLVERLDWAIIVVDRFLIARKSKPALSAIILSHTRSHESHKLSYKSLCDQRSYFLHIALAALELLVELWNQYSFGYRIYSINRPGRLLNFWTFKVGAYSRLGAYLLFACSDWLLNQWTSDRAE